MKRLLEIQKQYPQLTFQNKGYQYLSPEIKYAHKEVIEEINTILSAFDPAFHRFDNFKIAKDGTVQVRYQCDYNHGQIGLPFIGVHYTGIE